MHERCLMGPSRQDSRSATAGARMLIYRYSDGMSLDRLRDAPLAPGPAGSVPGASVFESSIRRDEDLKSRLLEAVPVGVIAVARDGAIVHANYEGMRIFDMSWDE